MRLSPFICSIYLAISTVMLPTSVSAQDDASTLCLKAKQAKDSNNSALTCDFAQKAIDLEGESACGGSAVHWTSLYCRKAPKPEHTFEYEYESDNNSKGRSKVPAHNRPIPQGPFKITIDPNHYSEMAEEDACTMAVKAKIRKDYAQACEYGQVAYLKSGDKACHGKAVFYIDDYCNKNYPPQSTKESGQSSDTPHAVPSSSGLSLDDICSLVVKAKMNKDYEKTYEYSKKAVELGGTNACNGKATEQIHNDCQDKTIPKQVKQPQPKPEPAQPVANQGMSTDDLCSLAVKAKIQKNTEKACEFYQKALKKGGKHVCKDSAATYVSSFCN